MTEQEAAADNGKAQENNAEEESELESAIIEQVEYYFGDMNLSRDKFMAEQIKLDEGWVPLDILLKFNRLAKLSKDPDVIATALNKSTSGLIEVSADNKKVRRSPEMPLLEMNEERRKELQQRTVYAKGFPKDSELDPILKYFKEHGEIESVIMRRYLEKASKERKFKGSVFATFKDKEQATKFLETKGQKYQDTELLVLPQAEYLQKKQEEYAEKKENRDKKNKQKDAANAERAEKEKESLKLPTGTVFLFSEASNTTKREDVRSALEAIGAEVAYIDFNLGDTTGWARLAKENAAIELVDKIPDGKLKIGDNEVVFKLIEGDEEKAYLERSVESMLKRRKNIKTFNKQNRNKSFKQHKGKHGRKRKQDGHDDAPPSKEVKADS